MIHEADTTITAGEKVLLMGESGTGKSTLIRAVAVGCGYRRARRSRSARHAGPVVPAIAGSSSHPARHNGRAGSCRRLLALVTKSPPLIRASASTQPATSARMIAFATVTASPSAARNRCPSKSRVRSVPSRRHSPTNNRQSRGTVSSHRPQELPAVKKRRRLRSGFQKRRPVEMEPRNPKLQGRQVSKSAISLVDCTVGPTNVEFPIQGRGSRPRKRCKPLQQAGGRHHASV
jgi:hypothetical protein